MAKLCRSGAFGGISKGLPARRQPHKKRTPQTLDASVIGCRPTPTPSVDLPSPDPAAVAVSIVVPVRNEAENVAPLIAEIAAALDGRWVYEIIYVNDGSADATAERLLPPPRKSRHPGQGRHAAHQ